MKFGRECGFKTLFVLSGASTKDDLEQMRASDSSEDRKCVPDYYTTSVGKFGQLLKL